MTELEQEFESIQPGKPAQKRFLRSQQDLKLAAEEALENGAEEEPEEG